MELQEIFDKVSAHLLRQGERSVVVDGYNMCMYRSAHGLKCAAGCLIPDDVYHPDMEHQPFEDLPKQYAAIEAMFNGKAVQLIQDLQEIHDMEHPEDWEDALFTLATREGLQFNKP